VRLLAKAIGWADAGAPFALIAPGPHWRPRRTIDGTSETPDVAPSAAMKSNGPTRQRTATFPTISVADARKRAERLTAASNGGRALSDDEIRKVWQAAASLGSFGGLVRLALLSALRRGELAHIERAREVLADRIVVRPEHSKTGNLHMGRSRP